MDQFGSLAIRYLTYNEMIISVKLKCTVRTTTSFGRTSIALFMGREYN